MGPEDTSVRHLHLVFRLLRRDQQVTAVAGATGAGTALRLHGLVGRKGALPQLVHDARGGGVHGGGDDYHTQVEGASGGGLAAIKDATRAA